MRIYNRALTAGEVQTDLNTAIVSGDTQAPTAPSLTATLTQDDVHLSWSGATDNVGITGYRVFRDGVLLTTLAAGATSYDDLNRPYGSYRYTVRAIDAAGNAGALSNEEAVTYADPDAGSPTTPVLTAAITDHYDVRLTWTAATDDLGIKEYRVHRGSQLLATVGPATTEWTLVKPSWGIMGFTVAAVDNAGHSTSSAQAAVDLDPDTTPPVPVFDTPCNGVKPHTFAQFQFYAPDVLYGGRTAWAEVDGRTVWGPVSNPASTTTFTWRSWLETDGPHVMKVHVRQADGTEFVSKPCELTVDNLAITATMAAPTNGATVSGVVTLDADVFMDGARDPADWSGWFPANNPWDVYFILDGNPNSYRSASDAPYTATLDTRVWPNGPHTVRADVVSAVDGYPARATSPTITFDIDNSPSRPTGVAAVAPGDDVLVSWNAAAGDPAVTGYRVFRDGTQIATVTDTAYTDVDRPNGTYEYTVVAVNSRGASQPSDPASATVDNADTTPPTVTFDDGCNGTKVHDYVDFRPLVSDDRGPVTAQVLLDGEPYPGAASLVAGRLRIDWDTRRYNVPNGTHVMTIVARDGAGNETSAPCEWNVQNPTVTVPFTSPADGATVSGTVNLAAQVLTDGQTPNWTGWLPAGNPVTGVAFEVVGKASRFDSAAPYDFAWDSTTVPNGTYTVRAQVQWMDYSLPRATNEIQITVDNPVPLPAPTGVAQSVTDDDVTLSWNAVAGATRYRVQRNGSDVGTTSGTSFTDANVPVGTHQYRVIAEDSTRTSVPSAAVSATVAPPPPSGLVAAYGFEQTSGTSVTDSSGKGSTGTLSGATWVTGGKFGRALSFDGVNDLVTVPDSNLLDLAPGMTLEAWVKPTTVSDWRTVLLKERPGQLAYALYAAGEQGRPMAEVAAGTQRDARGTTALPVGAWTHLAATYDKSTLRLYVNGTQVSSTAVTGNLLNSTGALRVGGNSVWGEYFSGVIDEVRVYERALSAAEIAADKDRAV